MAILDVHTKQYRAIFKLPGMLASPSVLLGYQDIRGEHLPKEFRFPSLVEYLIANGVAEVEVVDHFDNRAHHRFDLNQPVDPKFHERYATVIDIGTIEHVFDAAACLESSLRMTSVGGLYMLMAPVAGYYTHGFHTFHPEWLLQALDANAFKLEYYRYTASDGTPLKDPREAEHSLIWLVARKQKTMVSFKVPQQGLWEHTYLPEANLRKKSMKEKLNAALHQIVPPFVFTARRAILKRPTQR